MDRRWMTVSWWAALGGVLMLALAGPAGAQGGGVPADVTSDLAGLSLEQLVGLEIDSVVGASAYAQKITEAPSSVTIVTADDIRRHGHRTLADILRRVRGFYVTSDRNYSYLGVRGFNRPGDYNARILLLVDGHRLNDNVFGSALIGTEFPLDVELIDRVEIIRGPSSSLYGTSAFFAVINVITRRGSRLQGAEVTGSMGSMDSRRAGVAFGRQLPNGAELLLSGSAFKSHGQRRLYFQEFDTPDTNNGIAENADGDEFTHYLGRLTFKHLTVQGLFGTRTKTVPTASFGTVFNDARSGTVETQGFVDVQYNRTLARAWQTSSHVYYDRYAYDGTYVFEAGDVSPDGRVVNKDFARGGWWGAELRVTRRFARRHTLMFGSEYRDNLRQHQYNYDLSPLAWYLDDRRTSTNWAVFAQSEMPLGNRLLANVGVRHDQYDTFGGTTNPRVALIYTPAPKTTIKGLYGGAFRAPNAYELYWFQSDVAKANPLLRPETNRTAELVVEHDFGPALRVGATAFHYTIRDLITQQTDPLDGLLVYNNVDAIRARGVELELEGKWPGGLTAGASYTFQNSFNEETRQRLTNSPRHLLQANLVAPVTRRLFVGAELRHLSSRRTLSGGEVGAGVVPNVTLSGETKRLQISATLFNIFDNQYADPGSEEHRQDSIVQNGRTFRVRVVVGLPRTR